MIPFDRPRGTIHDLQKALGYGSGGCHALVLSDATLYVLQNLAALDITFMARWAETIHKGGYDPITDQSENYGAWVDLIDQVQREIQPMTCDLVAELGLIRAQMEQCCTGQMELMAAISSAGNNQAVTEYLTTNPYYDPPSGNVPPPAEMGAHCQRAWSWTTRWVQANVEAHEQAVIIGQGGIGVLMVIFSLLSLPLAILLGIAAVIVVVALEIDVEAYEDALLDAIPDIVCAIYRAPTSAQAVAAARAVIQNLPVLNVRAKNMLASQVTNLGMDSIFDESFVLIPGMPTDCTGCPLPGAELVLTSPSVPYNVILEGWLYDFEDESEAWGWSSQGAGARLMIAFVPAVAVQDVRVTIYAGADAPPKQTSIAIYQVSPWLLKAASGFFDVTELPPGTDAITYEFPAVALEQGEEYRLHIARPQVGAVWANRIVVEEYTPA